MNSKLFLVFMFLINQKDIFAFGFKKQSLRYWSKPRFFIGKFGYPYPYYYEPIYFPYPHYGYPYYQQHDLSNIVQFTGLPIQINVPGVIQNGIQTATNVVQGGLNALGSLFNRITVPNSPPNLIQPMMVTNPMIEPSPMVLPNPMIESNPLVQPNPIEPETITPTIPEGLQRFHVNQQTQDFSHQYFYYFPKDKLEEYP